MSLPAERRGPGFDPEQLVFHLDQDFPAPDSYWVGFSGGLDSTLLLKVLAERRHRLSAPLHAVHIDHGLQEPAEQWSAHCRSVCDQLGVPLTSRKVDAHAAKGESPEAAARTARYDAIKAALPSGAMLLTAHHLDDQAETLLLQLLRGAGVAGLAAMPGVQPFGEGWHARPLLNVSRQDLMRWAQQQGVQWIDDPTNASTTPDRNFLRHAILPTLRSRWPAASQSVARSASHCAGALEALQQQAAEDLGRVERGPDRVDLAALSRFSAFRQRAIMLHWLQQSGAPAPSSVKLREVLDQLLSARADASICFTLGEYELRRYGGAAWLIPAPPREPPSGRLGWPNDNDLVELVSGVVKRKSGPGGISRRHWEKGDIQIGFRREGLCCQPAGRVGRRTFKAIAQENRVPPWQRPFLPVIWINGQLAAIANCCVCEPFAADDGEPGWLIEWSRARADK